MSFSIIHLLSSNEHIHSYCHGWSTESLIYSRFLFPRICLLFCDNVFANLSPITMQNVWTKGLSNEFLDFNSWYRAQKKFFCSVSGTKKFKVFCEIFEPNFKNSLKINKKLTFSCVILMDLEKELVLYSKRLKKV